MRGGREREREGGKEGGRVLRMISLNGYIGVPVYQLYIISNIGRYAAISL